MCGSALRQCRATGLTNPLSVCSRPQCCSFAALLLESNLFLSSCAVPGRRRVKARRTDRATHRLSCREARRTDRATYRLSCREATRDQSPGGLDIKCNTCTSTCECHQRVMSATLSDTCPRCCQAASLRALAGWRKWSAASGLAQVVCRTSSLPSTAQQEHKLAIQARQGTLALGSCSSELL